MSWSREVTLWCDAEACNVWTCYGLPTVAATREHAQERDGWTREGDEDLCRSCSAELELERRPLRIEESWAPLVEAGLEWLRQEHSENAGLSHHGVSTSEGDRCHISLKPAWSSGQPREEGPPGRPIFVFNLPTPYSFSEEDEERTLAMVAERCEVLRWWNGAPASTFSIAIEECPDPSLLEAMERARSRRGSGGWEIIEKPEGW